MRQFPHHAGHLHTPQGQRKYLSASERLRFLDAAERASPKLKTLCLTLAWTGCRISEALALTHDMIDRESGVVVIRSLKKRRLVFREVPVPVSLIRAITEAHGSAVSATPLWTWSRSRAWQLIKAVIRDADIPAGPHAVPKGLRHAFGLHAIRSGIPPNLVQRWLGHASLATTSIYLAAVGQEEREIAARMWRPDQLVPRDPAKPFAEKDADRDVWLH